MSHVERQGPRLPLVIVTRYFEAPRASGFTAVTSNCAIGGVSGELWKSATRPPGSSHARRLGTHSSGAPTARDVTRENRRLEGNRVRARANLSPTTTAVNPHSPTTCFRNDH